MLGGIGNIYGAMIGGIVLGIIESLGAGYIGDLTGGFLGSHYQDIFAFVVLILVSSPCVRPASWANAWPTAPDRKEPTMALITFDTAHKPRQAYTSMAAAAGADAGVFRS